MLGGQLRRECDGDEYTEMVKYEGGGDIVMDLFGEVHLLFDSFRA